MAMRFDETVSGVKACIHFIALFRQNWLSLNLGSGGRFNYWQKYHI
jgi:hypothetical protein